MADKHRAALQQAERLVRDYLRGQAALYPEHYPDGPELGEEEHELCHKIANAIRKMGFVGAGVAVRTRKVPIR